MNPAENKYKIIRRIIIFGVLICIICAWFVHYRTSEVFEDVYSLYLEDNYSDALSLSKELPKPYKNYYSAYIKYRAELDEWEGSGSDLLVWFKSALETIDAKSEDDDERDRFDICSHCVYARTELLNEYDCLENAFLWYSKAQKTLDAFWEDFDDILSRNYELFAIQPVDDTVIISCDEILGLDEEMRQLYSNSIKDIDELMEQYDMEERFYDDLNMRKKEMAYGYSFYFEDYSLSSRFDLNGKENLYFSAENALNNYDFGHEYHNLNQKIRIYPFHVSGPYEILMEYVHMVFPNAPKVISVYDDME